MPFHSHLLSNTNNKDSTQNFCCLSPMEFDGKLRGTLNPSQPIFFPENYNMKPYIMKDEFPFVEAPSSKGFLQDFHHLDQFNTNGSSSNQMFGIQTACYDPFDGFPYGNCSTDIDFYECKPFINNGGHGHVMDNFQSNNGEYLNFPQGNFIDMMGSNQSNIPFDYPEMMKLPMDFVVPDEVSCVSAENDFYKKVGINKNRGLPSRRIWKGRKKSNVVKGQWTIEEDKLLIQLVEQYGLRKWSHIAQMLTGRIGKQCRERWHNHLRPDIKKDTWSEEEDKVLIQAHVEIGNKWAEIAKRLPGRTENSIKNHWNATKRRQFSKRRCRSKYPRGSILQDYIKSLNLDSSSTRRYQEKSLPPDAILEGNYATTKAPNLHPQKALDFCPNDRLVPNFDDFNEVPDFSFDEKLFQESCSIDSLLDEIDIARDDDEKDCDMDIPVDMAPLMDFEVKKELDLVEMISQANV